MSDTDWAMILRMAIERNERDRMAQEAEERAGYDPRMTHRTPGVDRVQNQGQARMRRGWSAEDAYAVPEQSWDQRLGQAIGGWFEGLTPTEGLSMLPIPGISDAAGLKADAEYFAANPEAMTPGNMALSAAGVLPFVPAFAGTFGGRRALSADLDMLEVARRADDAGLPQERIFDATGWFKGKDGEWRFEIDDYDAATTIEYIGKNPSEYVRQKNAALQQRMGDAINHDKLFNAYPDLEQIRIRPETGGAAASYIPPTNAMSSEWISVGDQPWEQTRTNLHEMQHAIQNREGFASGGSPGMFTQQKDAELVRDAIAWNREVKKAKEQMPDADWIAAENKVMRWYQENDAMDWVPSREARDLAAQPYMRFPEQYPEDYADAVAVRDFYGLDKQVTPHSGRELYKRLAGEVESRNVERRMQLTADDRRMLPPWLTEDVTGDKQIVRRNESPAASILDNDPKNYGTAHRPMTVEGGASTLDNLATSFGDDIYTKDALQYFGSGDPRERQVVRIMQSLKGRPDAKVKIYRGIPEGERGQINPGDWVTLSKEVAKDYGPNVIEMEVPASHITSWADSLLEFGYYPKGD